MSRSVRSERIPKNLVLISEETTIPSTFTYVSSLSCKYSVNVASCINPGSGVGSSSHSHTAACHTHASPPGGASHSHSAGVNTNGGQFGSTSGPGQCRDRNHSNHSLSISTTCAAFGSVGSACHSHASHSNTPEFITVKHIEKTSSVISMRQKTIPPNTVFIWGSSCLPSSTTQVTSLNGKLLKSVSSACATTGTTGGDTSHSESCGGSHSHSVSLASHSHSVSSVGTGGSTGWVGSWSWSNSPPNTLNYATGNHSHGTGSASLGNASGCSPSSCSGSHTHPSVSHLPPYKKVAFIKKSSTNPRITGVPKGFIGEWTGNLACIPTNWQLTDGTNGTTDLREKFLYGATSCIGTTGGTTTHQHGCSASHCHSVSISHSHPGSGSVSTYTQGSNHPFGYPTGGGSTGWWSHSHSVKNSSSSNANGCLSGGTHNHPSSSNLPDSIEIAFIERV